MVPRALHSTARDKVLTLVFLMEGSSNGIRHSSAGSNSPSPPIPGKHRPS
ncbi:hypothetical protein LINGRAHAP2_LOCUS11453 [Linum grandiflorum]